MQELLTNVFTWVGTRESFIIPLVFTLWIAWGDVKTRRIPNFLTLGIALGGLAYGMLSQGWTGLAAALGGMLLGFGFLILPYIWGGMGAGDVKALSALGAWLGPMSTIYLFCYMGIAGGLMALVVLGWRGLLWARIRQGWTIVINLVLCQYAGLRAPGIPSQKIEGIPYGVAIAAGMVVLMGAGG